MAEDETGGAIGAFARELIEKEIRGEITGAQYCEAIIKPYKYSSAAAEERP